MMQRQRFDISTDTGTFADTGPSFSGAILQIGWNPTTGDTGAVLAITLMPVPGDTGAGWVIYSKANLGSDFLHAPRRPQHGPDGLADTGNFAPVVAAGDRLRVKVTPSGAGFSGSLYVWTVD